MSSADHPLQPPDGRATDCHLSVRAEGDRLGVRYELGIRVSELPVPGAAGTTPPVEARESPIDGREHN